MPIIIPGKIPYIKKASLNICLTAGTMIDQTKWIPSNDHAFFNNVYLAPFENLVVTIKLDDIVLLDQDLTRPIEFEYSFEDSELTTDHCLQIALSGLDDSHRTYLPGVGEVAPMMRIHELRLEQLSMKLAMENHGQCFYYGSNQQHVPSEFMGQNGVQILNFSTPIYPWLLSIYKKPEYFF